MKFKVFFALVLLLFFSLMKAVASPEDSAKKVIQLPTLIKYIDGNAFLSQQVSYHALDTTLDYIETINPAIGQHHNYLANIGSAASPQIFSPQQDVFTSPGIHTYDLYLFNEETIRYFKTNKAFSEITYHLAGGKESRVNVVLSENISKNWNAGLDFRRLGSKGFMKNGSTFHSNFDMYTWLHSTNNRYNLLAFACWNLMENNVNGGLHSDSIYDTNTLNNLALQGLLVNLPDGQNHFRNHKFSLSQFYDLGSSEGKNSDSAKTTHFRPRARIEHSISLEARSFTYIDTDPGTYYVHTYFTPSSLDSLHYYDLRNRISVASSTNLKNLSDSSHSFYYSVALEHQWLRYGQVAQTNLQFLDTVMENTSVIGSLSNYETENKLYFKATGNYVLAGVNKADYKGEISIHVPVFRAGFISLSGNVLQQSPEFIFQRFYSNHFIWENNFEKNSMKHLSLSYAFPRYKISFGATVTALSKFIYADSAALPAQEQNEVRVLNYFLDKNFRVGKFHFNNSIIAQKVTSSKDVLHLPDLISTQSLFYESFFYRNALLLRIGFDFHFNSSYYADAFMPATGLFYWQNEKKTGGFTLIDFFVNFRIKTARFFLKFENIGDPILDKGYYFTPHYPMQGMTLQFGVCWRFFDQ